MFIVSTLLLNAEQPVAPARSTALIKTPVIDSIALRIYFFLLIVDSTANIVVDESWTARPQLPLP